MGSLSIIYKYTGPNIQSIDESFFESEIEMLTKLFHWVLLLGCILVYKTTRPIAPVKFKMPETIIPDTYQINAIIKVTVGQDLW